MQKILRRGILFGISGDGATLIFLDGSRWTVSPEYVEEIRKWKPMTEISVTVGYRGSEWPYKIINGDGNTAMAYRRRPIQREVMRIE